MLNDANCFEHIYLICGYTDLRCGIDGLTYKVRYEFNKDPFEEGSVFLFCGRKNDRIKALHFEGDGFLLLYKRLTNGKYRWPRSESEIKNMTIQQYRWLMDGLEIEQKKVIKKSLPTAI